MPKVTAVLVAILFVAPFIDWVVAGALLRAWRSYPHIHALRERAVVAIAIAGATTVYFAVAFNAINGFPVFDTGTGQLIARLAVASVGLVPSYWLWLYWRGKL